MIRGTPNLPTLGPFTMYRHVERKREETYRWVYRTPFFGQMARVQSTHSD
jgi:hypothetical protein